MATNWYDSMESGNTITYSNWNTMVPEIRHNNTGSDWYNMDAPDDIILDASSKIIMKDDGDQMLKVALEAQGTTIYGTDENDSIMIIKANDKDTYPFIQIQGASDVGIDLATGGDFDIEEQGSKIFQFDVDGDDSRLFGGDDANDDMIINANSSDTYPYIKLNGAGDIILDTNDDVYFYKTGSETFQFTHNRTTSNLYGGSHDEKIVIKGNTSNTQYISVGDSSTVGVGLGSETPHTFRIWRDGTPILIFNPSTASKRTDLMIGWSDQEARFRHYTTEQSYISFYGEDHATHPGDIRIKASSNILLSGNKISISSQLQAHTISCSVYNGPSVGAGASNLSDLTIDADKDWNSKTIYNAAGISSASISGGSIRLTDLITNSPSRITMKSGSTQIFDFTYDGTTSIIEGGIDGKNLKLLANDIDAQPAIALFDAGNIDIRLHGNQPLTIESGNTALFSIQKSDDNTVLKGGSLVTDDMYIYCNDIAQTYSPFVYMEGSGAMQLNYNDSGGRLILTKRGITTHRFSGSMIEIIPSTDEPSQRAGVLWLSGTTSLSNLYICSANSGGWNTMIGGGGDGVSNLSDLTINADKDWNSKGIHNMTFLSSQTISGGSIITNSLGVNMAKFTPSSPFHMQHSGGASFGHNSMTGTLRGFVNVQLTPDDNTDFIQAIKMHANKAGLDTLYGFNGTAVGANTTNIGIYAYAGGATNNYGLYIDAGDALFKGDAYFQGNFSSQCISTQAISGGNIKAGLYSSQTGIYADWVSGNNTNLVGASDYLKDNADDTTTGVLTAAGIDADGISGTTISGGTIKGSLQSLYRGWANVSDAGTIAHGCPSKPSYVNLSPSGANPIMYSFTVDATNITVYHSSPDAQSFSWRAEV